MPAEPSAELKKEFPDVDPFLLYKWQRAYEKFFDINESGDMDWGDSHIVFRKVREIYGAQSAQTKLAKEKLKALWEELLKVADDNKDKRISESEFCKVLKAHDPKNNVPWYLDYATFIFKLFDVSEDGKLDLAEYADGMLAYGHDEGEAHKAFAKFAVDAKGKAKPSVDWSEYHKLWDEYFYSKDKKAPGNHIFGVIDA